MKLIIHKLLNILYFKGYFRTHCTRPYFQMLCHRYRRINKLCTIDVNRKAFTLQSRPHLAIIQPEEVKGGEVLFKSNVQIDSKVFGSFIRSVFLQKASKSFYYFSLNGFTMAVSVSDICENTKVKNSFLESNVQCHTPGRNIALFSGSLGT